MTYTYLTKVTYQSTSGQNTFAIPFDYLREAFVKVAINNIEVTENFNISNRTVVFTKPVDNGSTITIYRQTPTKRLVSWADASVLKAKDMNITGVQELHILEEQQDKSNEVLFRANGALESSNSTLEQAKEAKKSAALSATSAAEANKEAQQAKEYIDKKIGNDIFLLDNLVLLNGKICILVKKGE